VRRFRFTIHFAVSLSRLLFSIFYFQKNRIFFKFQMNKTVSTFTDLKGHACLFMIRKQNTFFGATVCLSIKGARRIEE